MIGNRSKSAITLLETVIAIFLVAGGGLTVLQLFGQGIYYLGRSARLTESILVAENVIARLRVKAQDPNFFDGDWSSVHGSLQSDPHFPGCTVKVEVASAGLSSYSPSLEMESIHPADQQRVLPRSVIPVLLTVKIDDKQDFKLMTYIAGPALTIDPDTAIVVTRKGGGGTIPAYDKAQFEAKFLSASGQEIPGVMFSWAIEPLTGNATIMRRESSRTGKTVDIENKYAKNFRTNTWGVRPGTAKIRATARYNGVEYAGYSAEFDLGS